MEQQARNRNSLCLLIRGPALLPSADRLSRVWARGAVRAIASRFRSVQATRRL